MKIDRDRFRLLVSMLATSACGGSGAAPPVIVAAIEPTAPDAGVAVAVVEPPPKTEVEAPKACAQDNDVGDVDCTPISKLKLGGPTCEGAAATCDLLAQGVGFRRRSAAAAAACLVRIGARVCSIQARKKCYEEGLKAACPEPQFEAICAQKMDACRAARARVAYTKDDCVRAISGQKAGPDRDWAISAMGPSSEGKCELQFTVY